MHAQFTSSFSAHIVITHHNSKTRKPPAPHICMILGAVVRRFANDTSITLSSACTFSLTRAQCSWSSLGFRCWRKCHTPEGLFSQWRLYLWILLLFFGFPVLFHRHDCVLIFQNGFLWIFDAYRLHHSQSMISKCAKKSCFAPIYHCTQILTNITQ